MPTQVCGVLLLAILFAQTVYSADLYKLLNLNGDELRGKGDDTTQKAIKDAYKKFVRKNHPNHYQGPDNADVVKARFVEVTDAYEILSDDQKKMQYDRSGQKPVNAGDRYNYLRHNLFNEDFFGDKIDSNELERIINGKSATSQFVFFWSSNFPECVEAGGPFKLMSAKLRSSSVRVSAINCDNNVNVCRSLLLPNHPKLPVAMIFPPHSGKGEAFTGKFEVELLTQFATSHSSMPASTMISTYPATMIDTCPLPANAFKNTWAGAYFWETHKRCWVGERRMELVTFEYSPCYDCETELIISLESLLPALPGIQVRRVNCKGLVNKELCSTMAPQVTDKAWVIARVSQRCSYAMKRPFVFSDEACESLVLEKFQGKYQNQLLSLFAVQGRPFQAPMMTEAEFNFMKTQNDSYVILYIQRQSRTYDNPLYFQWELTTGFLNEHPYRGKKGFFLRMGTVVCEDSGSLCNGLRIPSIQLYSFGVKAKKATPHSYNTINSVHDFVEDLKRDSEPLHLYQLNGKNYDKKLSQSLAKGRKWFVLFNAGQWCPPCNQIRSVWRDVARIVQESGSGKKLAVAVVECDEQRTLCNKLGIDNYPTTKFMAKGRATQDYAGGRDAQSMADWAIDAIENRLLKLDPRGIHDKITSGEKIVVTFNAGSWCPPCTQLNPTIKKIASQMPDVQIVNFNCDEEQYFCNDYGIEAYPTIKYFHGRVITEYTNPQKTLPQITAWIKTQLSK